MATLRVPIGCDTEHSAAVTCQTEHSAQVTVQRTHRTSGRGRVCQQHRESDQELLHGSDEVRDGANPPARLVAVSPGAAIAIPALHPCSLRGKA